VIWCSLDGDRKGRQFILPALSASIHRFVSAPVLQYRLDLYNSLLKIANLYSKLAERRATLDTGRGRARFGAGGSLAQPAGGAQGDPAGDGKRDGPNLLWALASVITEQAVMGNRCKTEKGRLDVRQDAIGL